MGRPFLERFYYSVLPDAGLIFGSIAYVDGAPAGFGVSTPYPGKYIRMGIRRHPFRFGAQMALAFLADPRRVASALRARKRMAATPARSNTVRAPRPFVEGLFIAVAPEYSDPKFIRGSGLHISRDLMMRSLRQAAAYGTEMRAGVMRSNIAALMLHLDTGWKIEEDDRVLPIGDEHLELSHSLAGAQPGAAEG